jgi:hypothetical protein
MNRWLFVNELEGSKSTQQQQKIDLENEEAIPCPSNEFKESKLSEVEDMNDSITINHKEETSNCPSNELEKSKLSAVCIGKNKETNGLTSSDQKEEAIVHPLKSEQDWECMGYR